MRLGNGRRSFEPLLAAAAAAVGLGLKPSTELPKHEQRKRRGNKSIRGAVDIEILVGAVVIFSFTVSITIVLLLPSSFAITMPDAAAVCSGSSL